MKTTFNLKTIGGIGLAVVIITTLFWWLGPDLEVRRALAFKDQLADSGDLSRVAKNSLKTQLMRTVDEMDRNSLRRLRDKLRDEMRQFTETSIQAYQSASDEEKVVILDEAINRMVNSRDVYSALRSGRGWWGGRGQRGRGDRGTRGDQAARGDQRGSGERAGRGAQGGQGDQAVRGAQAGRGDQAARGQDRGQDRGENSQRPELTEEQRAERAERMEFYAAMGERAEERGVEMGRWGWGRWR